MDSFKGSTMSKHYRIITALAVCVALAAPAHAGDKNDDKKPKPTPTPAPTVYIPVSVPGPTVTATPAPLPPQEPIKIYIDRYVPVTFMRLETSVYFEPKSAALNESTILVLNRLIAKAKYHKLSTIELTGYTDSSGGQSNAVTLSFARAITVRNYLLSKLRGYESFPVGAGISWTYSNKTPAGRALNRRVDITITGVKK